MPASRPVATRDMRRAGHATASMKARRPAVRAAPGAALPARGRAHARLNTGPPQPAACPGPPCSPRTRRLEGVAHAALHRLVVQKGDGQLAVAHLRGRGGAGRGGRRGRQGRRGVQEGEGHCAVMQACERCSCGYTRPAPQRQQQCQQRASTSTSCTSSASSPSTSAQPRPKRPRTSSTAAVKRPP